MDSTIVLIILIAIIVVVVLFLIGLYNGLVTRRNRIDEAFGQIDVQLKRRHDLIPNLVQAVKGYMGFEQDVLTRVTEARANAVTAGARGPAQQAQAENMLTGALKSLFSSVCQVVFSTYISPQIFTILLKGIDITIQCMV